jgi:hypothetical protein
MDSIYSRGVEMTRSMLRGYFEPNGCAIAPYEATNIADLELLYLLEGDQGAMECLKGMARHLGAQYPEHNLDLTGPNSDPRAPAIVLQILSAGARYRFPYSARESWGSTWWQAGLTGVIFVGTFVTGGPVELNVRAVEETTCPHGDLGHELGSPVAQGDVPEDGQVADGDNACHGGPPRVTYQWQAPSDGTFVFDSRGSDYDTVLAVRRECFGEVLDCNDDTVGVQSQVVLEMYEGQEVIVEIAMFGGVSCTSCPVPHYQLNIEQVTF